MTNKGFIYLSQPYNLIGTNNFEISYDLNLNIDDNKRYLCISECNCLKMFDILLVVFNNNFKSLNNKNLFEGDEIEIKNVFNLVLIEYDFGLSKKDKLDYCSSSDDECTIS